MSAEGPGSSGKNDWGLNPRQKRFVELHVLEGLPATKAYEGAGYAAKDDVAKANASRLLTNANVQAYKSHLEEERKKAATLTSLDLDYYLSQVITTPLSEIGPDSPLCVSYKKRVEAGKGEDDPDFEVIEVKKPDPLKAVEQLKKTFGDYAPEKHDHTYSALDELFKSRKPVRGLHNDTSLGH